MRPLAAWPLPRVLATAVGWSALVVLVALLTPPGRFLIWLWGTLQTQEPVNADVPVAALKVWFIVVPLLAFGPSAALIVAWLREKGVRSGGPQGYS